MTISCSTTPTPQNYPRLECVLRCEEHEPYEWALPGNIANLRKVDRFLRKRNKRGYLFGGCLNKDLPRKDIDVAIETYLDLKANNKGYRILGVDWWFIERYLPMTSINVNGIEYVHNFYLDDYLRKESGLLLPKDFILKNSESELVRALYSKKLKGGDGE